MKKYQWNCKFEVTLEVHGSFLLVDRDAVSITVKSMMKDFKKDLKKCLLPCSENKNAECCSSYTNLNIQLK